MLLLWSSVFRIMEERNRLFVFGALLSMLEPELASLRLNNTLEVVYLLAGQVCTNPVLLISCSLLLGLFEDEFGDVPVQIVVLHGGGHRRAHLCPNEVRDHRGER